MMRTTLIVSFLMVIFSFGHAEDKKDRLPDTLTIIEYNPAKIRTVYDLIKDELPRYKVFEIAYTGYQHMKQAGHINQNILTIIDYELSSNEKRLWVIDMRRKKVLFNDLVAHGRKSGDEFATKFSNSNGSNMSSLGFFNTGNTYSGKHGLSLYLEGVEYGINHNAKERYIVMHGANYVSDNYIKKYGRLGRSLGCPAIPLKNHKKIIETIADKTCIYIHGKSDSYIEQSAILQSINTNSFDNSVAYK